MNSRKENSKYLRNINSIKKIIEKKLTMCIKKITIIDSNININYKNRMAVHKETEDGMWYCDHVIECGHLKMIERTTKPYIDPIFQDYAQEELQLLGHLNEAYLENSTMEAKGKQKRKQYK